MASSRSQPAMLAGLSRFLVEHERCGAGFDVAHPAGLGSGRVGISCRGCGARHEYATATIEVEREIELEAVTTPAPGGAEEGAAATGGTLRPGPASAPRRLPPASATTAGRAPRPRRRLPAALRHPSAGTAALVLIAVAAAIFALVRLSGGDEAEPPANAPAGGQPAPPPEAPASPPPPGSAPASPPAPTPITTQRYEIALPAGWTQRTAGGGLQLAPESGGGVSVTVFFQRDPGLNLEQMATATASFLRSRTPDAAVTEASRITLNGDRGFELRASGDRVAETALGVARGPYRYLLVKTVPKGTPLALVEEADTAVSSFRPR